MTERCQYPVRFNEGGPCAREWDFERGDGIEHTVCIEEPGSGIHEPRDDPRGPGYAHAYQPPVAEVCGLERYAIEHTAGGDVSTNERWDHPFTAAPEPVPAEETR